MNLLNVENLRSFRKKTSGLRADTPTKGRGLFFFFPEPRFVGFKIGTLFLSSDNAVGPPEDATPRDSTALWQVPSALSTSEASGMGWGSGAFLRACHFLSCRRTWDGMGGPTPRMEGSPRYLPGGEPHISPPARPRGKETERGNQTRAEMGRNSHQ